MSITRRHLTAVAAGLLAAPVLASSSLAAPRGAEPLRGQRLRAGDTIGLIEPASASSEPFDLTLVEEAIRALGFVPKRAAHLLQRYGYLAGQDRDRAADVNAMFADKNVKAIFAVRGGWGCARILPYLDYDLIRANPKPLMGYSDITALHMALQAKTGLVSLHGPNASSAWGKRSVESFKPIAMEAALASYVNPVAGDDRLIQRKWRTQTVRGGVAQGRLLGGNLTVLSALVGTPYVPNFDGAILFLEDIDEAEYRIDRMLTQLALAGMLKNLAGIIFGQCTECTDPDRGFGSFTLSDLFQQHFRPLNIPVFQGAFIGHMPDQFTIPVGVRAEMNADAGTLRLLEAAVL
jgi:muramoyltetrapeptide carboxypeptidase